MKYLLLTDPDYATANGKFCTPIQLFTANKFKTFVLTMINSIISDYNRNGDDEDDEGKEHRIYMMEPNNENLDVHEFSFWITKEDSEKDMQLDIQTAKVWLNDEKMPLHEFLEKIDSLFI